jgi:hypothetical protein
MPSLLTTLSSGLALACALGAAGAAETRDALTAATLHGRHIGLIDYDAYAPPAGAAAAGQVFEGTLTLTQLDGSGGFREAGTHAAAAYRDPQRLPPFAFQFIQHGAHLVPLRRGLLDTGHPNWQYIIEPGRVWQEDGDDGYSRVAIPFALQEKGANCTHNGVLSFLFKSDGSTSRAAFQIAGETCAYFKFDLWGMADARYTPQAITGAAAVAVVYQAEVTARMPTRPISALADDYPAAGVVAANLGADQRAADMTVYGVALDGVNYVGGCQTRRGRYPYCEVLDLPSYSLAKSIAGAIGLMRLEKKYPGSQSAPISDAAGPCGAGRWDGVTLLDALDMATGHYASAAYEADEDSAATEQHFFVPPTYRAKAGYACAYGRQTAPGALWVYHTSDTFLLGAALNRILRRHTGGAGDYYDMLAAELWRPLQLSPATWTTARTRDLEAVPLTGYGLTLHHDDLVKLGEFLNKDNASIAGVPMLDATLYNEAMQRTGRHGLDTGKAGLRYLHGLWAWNAGHRQAGAPPLCPAERWIPHMSGYGGIGLMLLPNDMIYYFVSDRFEYGFQRTLTELNKIRSLC